MENFERLNQLDKVWKYRPARVPGTETAPPSDAETLRDWLAIAADLRFHWHTNDPTELEHRARHVRRLIAIHLPCVTDRAVHTLRNYELDPQPLLRVCAEVKINPQTCLAEGVADELWGHCAAIVGDALLKARLDEVFRNLTQNDLKVLVYLFGYDPQPRFKADVAAGTDLSESTLRGILKKLGDAHLIEKPSERGGYQLTGQAKPIATRAERVVELPEF